MSNLVKQRLTRLQSSLAKHQSILLSRNSDVFYFSSFSNTVPEERNAFVLISQSTSHLIMQNFLPQPSDFLLAGGRILTGASGARLAEHLTHLQTELELEEISLDLAYLSVEEFQAISKVSSLRIDPLDKTRIWQLRTHKDETEISKIKTAIEITRQAIAHTIDSLRIGQSELEVKQILENKMREHLETELAFPSIVAFDENSILPHHQSGDKKLVDGAVVLIDAGAKYQNYCADMTRTVFFKAGNDDERLDDNRSDASEKSTKELEFEQILSIVQEAQTKAKKLADKVDGKSEAITVADLDLACRVHIEQAGFGKNFIHTTGHGLGLDIHEPPSIYKSNTSALSKNMVITIEPGIYLEGKFGVRWEDTVIL